MQPGFGVPYKKKRSRNKWGFHDLWSPVYLCQDFLCSIYIKTTFDQYTHVQNDNKFKNACAFRILYSFLESYDALLMEKTNKIHNGARQKKIIHFKYSI